MLSKILDVLYHSISAYDQIQRALGHLRAIGKVLIESAE
jgi:hypothetical protein